MLKFKCLQDVKCKECRGRGYAFITLYDDNDEEKEVKCECSDCLGEGMIEEEVLFSLPELLKIIKGMKK